MATSINPSHSQRLMQYLHSQVGFFGKYYVFYNAVLQGEIVLAFLGVLTSVIAAFYYLKIVKYMYFMDAEMAAQISVVLVVKGDTDICNQPLIKHHTHFLILDSI